MKHGHQDLVVDFGSSSIGGAFVVHASKQNPTMSQVKRVPIGGGTQTTRENLMPLATEAFKTLLSGFQAGPAPARVRIVLASPWYNAKIKTVTTKSDKSARITSASIVRAVHEYQAKNKEASPGGPGRVPVESVITQAYVNGYPTAVKKPVVGSAVKINLYESETDESLVRTITDLVKAAFPGAAISFHSFPLLAFIILRAERQEASFIFLDIGGEVTDVAVVHRDSLRFLASFPHGALSLVRDIGGEKGIADTASRLALFARGELTDAEAKAFTDSFAKAASSWNTEYEKILEAAASEVPVSQTTFVAADREELPWLLAMLKQGHGVFSARSIPLSNDYFQSSVTLGDGGFYDAFLSLAAVFFHIQNQDLMRI